MAYTKKTPVDLNCPLRLAQCLIGAKWKPCIIDELRDGLSLRPSEIKRRLPDAPIRVLAIQLKELVDDGLVSKEKFSSFPPHTEYRLTETGSTLLPIIDHMIRWGEDNIELFRKKFGIE